jgi:hypothetical protein
MLQRPVHKTSLQQRNSSPSQIAARALRGYAPSIPRLPRLGFDADGRLRRGGATEDEPVVHHLIGFGGAPDCDVGREPSHVVDHFAEHERADA